MMSERGKKLGSWAVQSGHLARAREHCDYKAMGQLSGRIEGAGRGREITRHNRWHVTGTRSGRGNVGVNPKPILVVSFAANKA